MPDLHFHNPFSRDRRAPEPSTQGSTDKAKIQSSTEAHHAPSSEQAVLQAITEPRLWIDRVSPCVDGGQYPAKGVTGQAITVSARVFADGHNRLAARVLWLEPGAKQWHSYPLTLLGNDLWQTTVVPAKMGHHQFKVEAWLDRWQNYHHELHQKFYAGVPVALEVKEGRLLLQQIFDYACAQDQLPEAKRERSQTGIIPHNEMSRSAARACMHEALQHLEAGEKADNLEAQVQCLLNQNLASAVEVLEQRQFLTRTDQSYVVDVERTAAGYSAWYELFPRSITDSAERHGTFDDVIERLPAIQSMGFDVLYFPPIHPIGQRHRKGRNNSVTSQPSEPGSPYAIGAKEGGHDVVAPELGGIKAFRRLRSAAKHYGLEIALDFAIQCSPDHPWLEQHPDWFSWRPDGSIRYAENPPKKYQDIVNVDFYTEQARPAMWLAWRDIILYWISEGVHIFRVDNPHTKPLPFWAWLISDVRSKHPEAIFLSEAFTRPAMMYALAKVGFSQSYTYFIWRNSKRELSEYMRELTTTEVKDFYRPNFFVNTPDINPYFLQTSGRPGFLIRASLAATLSGLWGVYSGFELCEAEPIPGKEEYFNSEKYEIRPRDYNAPGNIVREITRLNQVRKENPALHTHLNARFLHTTNDNVLFFAKANHDFSNIVLIAISLDPHNGQETYLDIPTEMFNEDEFASFDVVELMRNVRFHWHGRRQHWYFDPHEIPFAIWRLQSRRV